MNFGSIVQANGLHAEDRERIERLVNVNRNKLERNQLRKRYYDAHVTAMEKNIGIAVPESVMVDISCSWASKAVDILQARSQFDGYFFEAGDVQSDISKIVQANNLVMRYERACTSELIHSVVFATLSRQQNGMPSIKFHSAETAAGVWNYGEDRIAYGMAVVEMRKVGKTEKEEPSHVNLYTDTHIVELQRDVNGRWRAKYNPHSMGRPMIEPMAYRPTEMRPFGKSRIGRDEMSIIDEVLRERLRMSIGSELFTSPQKYMMGASEEDFDKDRWSMYIGSWVLAGRDEEGQTPTIGQLSASSMQPHIEVLRSLAAQFSGSTYVPISSLGVLNENNPTSAESIYASKEDLINEAKVLNRSNGRAMKNIGLMALAIYKNVALSSLSEDEMTLAARFKNPEAPSLVSQADAIIKITSAVPWLAQTSAILEQLGFDEAERNKLLAQKRQLEAEAVVQQEMEALAQIVSAGEQ